MKSQKTELALPVQALAPTALQPLAVPAVIDAALRAGADCVWSLSGGKDSHALVLQGAPWFRAQGYPGRQYIIHADLGRAEWPQTAEFVERIAAEVALPLIVVRRPKGDLVARFEERLASVQAAAALAEKEPAPFWPSSQSRYCTSHLKSGPIDTALRNPGLFLPDEQPPVAPTAATPAPFWPSSDSRYCTSDLKRGPIDTALRAGEVVISAEGVRGDESRDRAKKPVVEVRAGITASSAVDASRNLSKMEPEEALAARQPGQRVALNWRPLFGWNVEEVWQACGTSLAELHRRRALYAAGKELEALDGWPCHPAYVFGNERLSCAFCVLGSRNDLLNGAQHNPELYGHLLRLEIKGNATFKNGWSLAQLPVTGRAAAVREQVLTEGKEGASC